MSQDFKTSFSKEEKASIQALVRRSGTRIAKKILTEALTIVARVIEAEEQGRIVTLLNERTGKHIDLVTPLLDRVSAKAARPSVTTSKDGEVSSPSL